MSFKLVRLIVAVPLVGFAIACMINAGLGLSPFDVLFSGVAHATGLSYGTANIITSVCVITIAALLGCRPGIATVCLAFGVGPSINATLPYLPSPHDIPTQVAWFVIGVVLLAVTAVVCIGVQLGVGPPEAMMLGLMNKGMKLLPARVCYELVALAIGWSLGGTVGVGTLVFALTIGPSIKLVARCLPGHASLLDGTHDVELADAPA